MELSFHKYQGTGNDFVIIDNRENQFDSSDLNKVRFLCHRKFGIGSDGLILIQNYQGLDFEMIFFNPDGTQSMCGNGSRCAVQFCIDNKIIPSNKVTHFMSTDGAHKAFLENDLIHLQMTDVERNEVERYNTHFQINTGSPHFIKMVTELDKKDMIQEGRQIRYNETYQEKGINVNLVEKIQDGHIKVRTYERGVEDETLSCGTGVTACAIAMHLQDNVNEIDIETAGGKLRVTFDTSQDGYHNIYLIGPAKKVFEGKIEIL